MKAQASARPKKGGRNAKQAEHQAFAKRSRSVDRKQMIGRAVSEFVTALCDAMGLEFDSNHFAYAPGH